MMTVFKENLNLQLPLIFYSSIIFAFEKVFISEQIAEKRFGSLLEQPWESAAAVSNAVLCEIYDDKKIAVVRFSMSAVFIYTTYLIISERLMNLFYIA